MSNETVRPLVERLRKIREIYEKGLYPFRSGSKGTAESIDYLQALAAERGVQLTRAELMIAVEEVMTEELSEATLDMVAGGTLTNNLFQGIKVGGGKSSACQPQTEP